MTYVDPSIPLEQPPDIRRRGGRPTVPIPPALIAQLQHSRATGARCVIDIDPADPADPAEIKQLKRAIVRCRYQRDFIDKTIRLSVQPTKIEYWVEPKGANGGTTK